MDKIPIIVISYNIKDHILRQNIKCASTNNNIIEFHDDTM